MWTVGHVAKSCRDQEKGKQGKAQSKEWEHKGKGKDTTGKGWWRSQKEKGQGKGLKSVSDWGEWDQAHEYNSVPIPSVSCGEKQPDTESPDLKITSEEWQVPLKRVKSTCTKTRAGSRQFVCNNKFEAIAEQSHDKKTKQDRKHSEV